MSDNSIKSLKPHVSLNVRNISDSVEFYKKLFGIEPLKYHKRQHDDAFDRPRKPRSSRARTIAFRLCQVRPRKTRRSISSSTKLPYTERRIALSPRHSGRIDGRCSQDT